MELNKLSKHIKEEYEGIRKPWIQLNRLITDSDSGNQVPVCIARWLRVLVNLIWKAEMVITPASELPGEWKRLLHMSLRRLQDHDDDSSDNDSDGAPALSSLSLPTEG